MNKEFRFFEVRKDPDEPRNTLIVLKNGLIVLNRRTDEQGIQIFEMGKTPDEPRNTLIVLKNG